MFEDTAAVPRAAVCESTTLETAERLLMLVGTADVPGLMSLFAPSVEWSGPMRPVAGAYSKRELEALVLACYASVSPAGLTVHSVVVDGDQAVVVGRARCLCRRTGDRRAIDFAAAFSVKDGLVTACWLLTGPGR